MFVMTPAVNWLEFVQPQGWSYNVPGVGHRREMFELANDHPCETYPELACRPSGDAARWHAAADAIDYLGIEGRDDDLLPNWSDWEVRELANA